MDLSKDLWISPHLSLRGRDGNRAWDRTGNLLPGAGARFLELADVALGIKKTAGHKKKTVEPIVRETIKSEPYSSKVGQLALRHSCQPASIVAEDLQDAEPGKKVGRRQRKGAFDDEQ